LVEADVALDVLGELDGVACGLVSIERNTSQSTDLARPSRP
jgi:hypothetical protein